MLSDARVIRIETETDIERLRQVALLQRAELDRLYTRLAQLTEELAHARGEDAIAALQLELTAIQEQLAARTRALFSPSSERRPRPGDRTRDAAPAPRTGHGPRAQLALPQVEVVHTLDVPDRTCPKCGGGLREMTGQYEESEEIDVVERSFRLVRHKRQKYTCRCGECIDTALGPPRLIPGGRYSVDFAVAVAVAKYGDHMPLARQVRQMARWSLATDTQTLWDQLHARVLLDARAPAVCRGRAALPAGQGADRQDRRALRDRGEGGRGRAERAAGRACGAARYGVAHPRRRHQDVAPGAGGAAALVARRGHQVHTRALGRA